MRPRATAFGDAYTSSGIAYEKVLMMRKVVFSDQSPRASPTIRPFWKLKSGLAGPPHRSLADTAGSPPEAVAPPSAALSGARHPEVSLGPVPRKSLLCAYL